MADVCARYLAEASTGRLVCVRIGVLALPVADGPLLPEPADPHAVSNARAIPKIERRTCTAGR
jgi:hypothetical protein